MSEQPNVQNLTNALIADAELRKAFVANPTGVIAEHGIELTDAQAAQINAIDWGGKDEILLLALLEIGLIGFFL